MIADRGFTERFGPRVVNTTLAVAWAGVGGLLVAADQATHAALLALINKQFSPDADSTVAGP